MSDYRIEFAPSARRQFEKLSTQARRRLAPAIDALEKDSRPPGGKRLAGPDDLWRLRVGAYRIVYAIEDDRLVVLVVKLGQRRDVYR
jgi:mRNA interferase RelE/StbE